MYDVYYLIPCFLFLRCCVQVIHARTCYMCLYFTISIFIGLHAGGCLRTKKYHHYLSALIFYTSLSFMHIIVLVNHKLCVNILCAPWQQLCYKPCCSFILVCQAGDRIGLLTFLSLFSPSSSSSTVDTNQHCFDNP